MLQELIRVRVDVTLKELLKKLTKNVPDGISRLTRKLFIFYINQSKDSEEINLELKQEIEHYLKERDFEKQKQRYKRKLFYYYIIGNTLKTIYHLSISHLVNSGEINMEIISKVLNNAEEVYNTYPEDIKNDLKSEFDNLMQLKDRNILMSKMKILKVITLKKQIRELEEKKEIEEK